MWFNCSKTRPFIAFLLKLLENVSSSGSGSGIVVTGHRGSILKGTKVSNFYKLVKIL
jgi:hypothetical protein